jgi:hypothetical protein
MQMCTIGIRPVSQGLAHAGNPLHDPDLDRRQRFPLARPARSNYKIPQQKASLGTSFAGFILFGADGETRTRTAYATTPSR